MTENDQDSTLTPKQERLIEALLSGLNVTLAAKATGVADKTARRWLKLEHFQRGYRAAQRAIFDQALQGLMLKVEKAIDTLDDAMSSEESPYSTRVRASQIVIEQAVQVYKTNQLEEKYEELEKLVRGIDE